MSTYTTSLTETGGFVIGANYWASHAGTRMWRDWDARVVDADFAALTQQGLQVLRVFPLWPDFQPLKQLYTYQGEPVEMSHDERPLPDTDAGRAGVSETAMQHFAEFADLADQHHLKLIVGLITGWMSGRLHVPPALEAMNVITDPRAVMWQVRFVRHFVRTFADHPAIAAWDLGNECNCMGEANRAEAWQWLANITDAIRAADPTRPVVSGMHVHSPDPATLWSIPDLAEQTDVMTTHPYPIFTPHCDHDPINTMRSCLHATAESRYYGDIGGRPCLCEEMGTLGPMLSSEAIAADYIRTNLFSLWAHDCHGLVWWCAHEQSHLTHTPYDWFAVERELGMLRLDRSPKPVTAELKAFGDWLGQLPIDRLRPRRTEAVCILTHEQDTWAVAFAAFVLAKQAGFDLIFQWADQPLRDAPLYLLPSVCAHGAIYARQWLKLLDRARNGAHLYVSVGKGLLSPFTEPFGLELQTRSRRPGPAPATMDGIDGQPTLTLDGHCRLQLEATTAHVLGREADGNPIFTANDYGRGKVHLLGYPLELALATAPAVFHGPDAQPAWQLYRHLAADAVSDRAVRKDLPQLGLTEHDLPDARRVIVAVNYSPDPVETSLHLTAGWQATDTWYGSAPTSQNNQLTLTCGANDAAVFVVKHA